MRVASSGVAMKIVPTAPITIPTMIANAKSCNVAPPNTYNAAIGSNVITDVKNDRRNTSHTDTLQICAIVARGINRMFSRTRSNTMIVS
jgi:hypothetical protein